MAVFLSFAERKEFGVTGANPRLKDLPPRLVLHTTETKVLPNYASPPHFTIAVGHSGSMPSLADGEVKIWQHVSLDKTAYALLHPKGMEETNHMGSHCVQIEIITQVGDQPKARIVGNRGHLPVPLLEAVAGLVREILAVVPGINPLVAPEPAKWSASGSASPKAPQRFSVEEWRAFNGICGHEHVPGNSHWDPGEFDIQGFLGLVTGNSSAPLRPVEFVASEPTPVPDPGWPKVLKLGDRNRKVAVLRSLIRGFGYGDLGNTDLYNAEVEEAVKKMQTDAGVKPDGKWGPDSHKAALARIQMEMARADVRL